MFSFIRERKVVAALNRISSGFEHRLHELSPQQKAASLAVANATLIAGAKHYGRPLAFEPMKLDKLTAIEALLDMAEQHGKLIASMDTIDGRSIEDPLTHAIRWELAALEICMLTAGANFHDAARRVARKGWAELGKSIIAAPQAVRALQVYATQYSVDPVPLKNPSNDQKAFLMSLASTLPPMFRPKKKTKR